MKNNPSSEIKWSPSEALPLQSNGTAEEASGFVIQRCQWEEDG